MCSTGRMWDVIFQCMASESHGITSLTPHHWHSCPPPRAKIPPLAHQNPLERCCSYASHSSGHIVCHKKDALSQVYPPMAQRYPQAFCILCTSYLKSDVKCGHSLCDPVVSCVTNICLDSIWIHNMIYYFFLMMLDALADMYILKYAIYVYGIWMVVVGITGDVHNRWTFIQLQNKKTLFPTSSNIPN